MRRVKETVRRCEGFTLIELIVVIAIILAIAALAAAFAPRVSNSTNLSRAIDQTEQWLLTAKMRAKRDGLATGIRFMAMPGGAAGTYSQFQYIQQPDPLSGAMVTTSSASGAYQRIGEGGVDRRALIVAAGHGQIEALRLEGAEVRGAVLRPAHATLVGGHAADRGAGVEGRTAGQQASISSDPPY